MLVDLGFGEPLKRAIQICYQVEYDFSEIAAGILENSALFDDAESFSHQVAFLDLMVHGTDIDPVITNGDSIITPAQHSATLNKFTSQSFYPIIDHFAHRLLKHLVDNPSTSDIAIQYIRENHLTQSLFNQASDECDDKVQQFAKVLVQIPAFQQQLIASVDVTVPYHNLGMPYHTLLENPLCTFLDIFDDVVKDFPKRFESFNFGRYCKALGSFGSTEPDHFKTPFLQSFSFLSKQIKSGLVTITPTASATAFIHGFDSCPFPTRINPTIPIIFGAIIQNAQYSPTFVTQLFTFQELSPINLNMKLMLSSDDLAFSERTPDEFPFWVCSRLLPRPAPFQSITPLQFATILDYSEIFNSKYGGEGQGNRDIFIETIIEGYIQSILDGNVDQIHPFVEFNF